MSQALPDAGPYACPLGPFPGNRAWQGPLRGRFGGVGERVIVGGGLLPLPANHMAPDLSLSLAETSDLVNLGTALSEHMRSGH